MNKRQVFAVCVGIFTLATGIFAVRQIWFSGAEPPADVPSPQTYDLAGRSTKLSGPYIHKNLTVYLIHADDVLKGKTPLTLEEAMERKLVVVHETEDVNELAIENVSAKDEVYVQAGDIVKGGKQDRVLGVDLIVPARSGRVPIDSFCVEQGRWTARGVESSTRFDSSTEYVASKDLKVAAKHSKSQGEVWQKVAESQEKLSAATNSNVASSRSRSSLPLALENSRVRADSGEYIKALADIVDGKASVIGFLFMINGEINSADTYGSSALFLKLWPKLLKASAIEAVAETDGQNTKAAAGVAEIEQFLAAAESAKSTEERAVTETIRIITRESDASVLIESLYRDILLHRNYILK